MRMSCNGCRVLRKGCSEDCTIRPCLQWIKNPESQANATVFLAKFYGRAGLLNLINAGPNHLRPAIFRSLLYEACGRIVNPVYGSVGLLWSGNWAMCQTAVEAVLKGAPITQMSADAAETTLVSPLKCFDIRHVAKEDGSDGQQRAKRAINGPEGGERKKGRVETENESSTSHDWGAVSDGHETDDTAEGSMVTSHGGEVELDLTLGLSGSPASGRGSSPAKRCNVSTDGVESTCGVKLSLDLVATVLKG